MSRTSRAQRASLRPLATLLLVGIVTLSFAFIAHSAIVTKDSASLFRDFLSQVVTREQARPHGQTKTARRIAFSQPSAEIAYANSEAALLSPAPAPPPSGDLDFGNPGSLPTGAACSTATSCTIAGGMYSTGVFNIPVGVLVQVTGTIPLHVSAGSVNIAGTLDASAGVGGGGGGGDLPGVDGGGGHMFDGTVVPNGGHAAPTGSWGNLGGGGGGGNGGGGGSGGSNGNYSGAGGDGIGPSVAGGAAVTTALTQGNPGQGGAGGGGGSGGTDTIYGQKAGGDGGGGVTGSQGDPQLTTFAGGGGGGHGGIDSAGTWGGQGGAGGGAIRLTASTSISISGTIYANGGGSNCASNSGYGGCGGGGAGGTIWLSAPSVTNSGAVSAVGGSTDNNIGGYGRGGGGGAGRIRVDNSTGVAPAGNFTPVIGYTGQLPNPVPHISEPLAPAKIAPGSGNTTVTIRGANFSSTSVARVDGADRTTTFVNGGEIQVEMLALDLVSARTITVSVFTGAPGGGTSNPAYLEVTNSNSSPQFATQAPITVTKGPRDILLQDLDGDGDLDAVVSGVFSNNQTILHGNGNGIFIVAQTLGGSLAWGDGVTAADFNGDGVLDLVFAGSSYSSSVFIALGQGGGTFVPATSFPVPMDYPLGVVAADFNRDGKMDVALTGRNTANMAVLLGDGAGGLGAATSYATGNNPHGIVTGDFNGDGNLDLAVAGWWDGIASVFLGTGTGSFGARTDYGTGGNPTALLTADLNGDGILDLIAHNDYPNNAYVLFGVGDGTFTGHGSFAMRAGQNIPDEIALGDVNGDGRLDLVGASRSDQYVSIALGDGAGNFAAPTTIANIANATAVAVGDVNGDGRVDILATSDFDFSTDGTVTVLLNVVPAISINPASINFGQQVMGVATTSQTVNVTNTGGANLVISSVGLSSGDVTEFNITQDTCTGVTLPPTIGACVVQVQYWPRDGVPSNDAANLTINSNDPGSPQSVQLTGQSVADTQPPAVTVIRPNGGEKLFISSPYYITWSASDNASIDHFDVYYSTNGGSTYPNAVPGCTGVPGSQFSCVWYGPGPTTTAGRIRVVATDAAGNSGMDSSNANYSVVAGAGSITVTQPNTALDWGIGSKQQIKWNHNLGVNAYVTIELSRDGRETWEGIAGPVKNTTATTGIYNWTVTGPVSPAARIRITGVDIPVGDMGNTYFSISEPYIGVAAPAVTSMNFGYGTQRTQTWTTNLGPLDKVDVLLSTDGGATCNTALGSNLTATAKTLTYSVPTLGSPTTNARICIRWAANPTLVGMNPVNFSVQPAYIQVTYPNVAQDSWAVGSSQTITWANNLGPAENVKIELSLDGGGTYPITILNPTPSDGTQAVTVQAGWATANAKIKITWLKNTTVFDVSSQAFPIN